MWCQHLIRASRQTKLPQDPRQTDFRQNNRAADMRLKLKEQKWNNTISAKHHKHMGNKSHYVIVIFFDRITNLTDKSNAVDVVRLVL